MKSKTKLAGFIIILLALAMIPSVSAFDDDQTRHIEAQDPGLDADWFVTETGVGFNSELVTITDPNMDIYAYLFFEDMKINYWHHLKNATLRLRTASTLSFDADSSVTIYGVDDYRFFGSGTKGYGPLATSGSIMNAPLTKAYVNLNTSQFYGPQWWEIDVTNIVQELKSNKNWDGPGLLQSDPGDNMGFIILSSGGHDTRYFYDLKAGNGYEAQLKLHWGGSTFPPSGYEEEAVWVEDYGNYTIWEIPGTLGYSLDPMEYIFENGTDPYGVSYENGTGPFKIGDPDDDTFSTFGPFQRKLARTSNGTLWATWAHRTGSTMSVYVSNSTDEGATWGSQLLQTWDDAHMTSGKGALAVDGADNVHVIWDGENSGVHAVFHQIWYSFWNGSAWSAPVDISDGAGMESSVCQEPSIAVDSDNQLHVLYVSKPAPQTDLQVYYSKYNGSWSTPLIISTYAGMSDDDQRAPGIAVDSNDYLHVSWYGPATGFAVNQVWYNTFTASWAGPIRLSTLAGMSTRICTTSSVAVDSSDNVQVVFVGRDDGFPANGQIWYTVKTGGWSDPLRISTAVNQENTIQFAPSIAVDSDDELHVAWHGFDTDDEKVWYALYNGSWNTPVIEQGVGQNVNPNLRWARWPVGANSTYLVTEINGTDVLADGFETVEDAQDWIDYEDPDPDDPEPPGWDPTGPFTRFKTRLYIFLMGFGMLMGPLMVFAYRRPTGYAFVIGLFVMLIGFGFLIHAGTV